MCVCCLFFTRKKKSHINRRWHPVIVRIQVVARLRSFFLQTLPNYSFLIPRLQIHHRWENFPAERGGEQQKACFTYFQETLGAHPQQDKINWTKCHKLQRRSLISWILGKKKTWWARIEDLIFLRSNEMCYIKYFSYLNLMDYVVHI